MIDDSLCAAVGVPDLEAIRKVIDLPKKRVILPGRNYTFSNSFLLGFFWHS
jgi:hypothetical protein